MLCVIFPLKLKRTEPCVERLTGSGKTKMLTVQLQLRLLLHCESSARYIVSSEVIFSK